MAEHVRYWKAVPAAFPPSSDTNSATKGLTSRGSDDKPLLGGMSFVA